MISCFLSSSYFYYNFFFSILWYRFLQRSKGREWLLNPCMLLAISLRQSICLLSAIFLSIYLDVCLSVHLFIYKWIYQSGYLLFIYSPMSESINLVIYCSFIHLWVSLSIWLSTVHLFIYQRIYQSGYLSFSDILYWWGIIRYTINRFLFPFYPSLSHQSLSTINFPSFSILFSSLFLLCCC